MRLILDDTDGWRRSASATSRCACRVGVDRTWSSRSPIVVDTLVGTGVRKSAPQPGGARARITAISASRVSARYRSRARTSHGRSTGSSGGFASRRSAWVSSHSGDSANRLMVRSSLPTSSRSIATKTFRPTTKEYAPDRPPRTLGSMTATISTSRPAPATARTTYRSVFAAGEFRVLFAALLMYVLGFEFEILGLSVLVYA